ncbi:MAG: FAD-binding oxidoreductase, partial [Dehalococcoidia bacterium]|nr:FAD-binding oxidoreductase [Dehalococcoidia bacterium]
MRGASALRAADVVIVGGGVVGCAIAYHLARQGVTNVVVIEANRLASGTTSSGAGGIRCQYATDEEIIFSRESRAFYARAADILGDDCGFRAVGFLYLLRSDDEIAARRQMAAQLARHGVEMRILSTEETRRQVPGLAADGVLGGALTPDDGT